MLIIVGLGNPTAKYANTYHNVGFLVVDALAEKLKVKFKTTECQGKTASYTKGAEEVVLVKPQTFMNLSGVCVRQILTKYHAEESDLLIIYDDVDLPIGQLRFREHGSAGTHNGMRNIVAEVGSTEIKRLRMGTQDEDIRSRSVALVDKVLSPIAYEEKAVVEEAVERAANGLCDLIRGIGWDRFALKVNTKI